MSSGTAAVQSLLELGHEVTLIDLAAELPILAGPLRFPAALPPYHVPNNPPDIEQQRLWRRNIAASLLDEEVLACLHDADMTYVAVHGGWGEDGHLQSWLEMLGVPFTGPRSDACSAAWHKARALAILQVASVPTAPRVIYRANDPVAESDVRRILGDGPAVVKPATGGSSVNTSVVRGIEELHLLDGLAASEGELLVESYLSGREFTVGVLGEEALPVVEILLASSLFDYQAKYQIGAVAEVCPAEISSEFSEQLQEIALRAHRALGFCQYSYSRIDFRCDADGMPVCLEVNALPGLTPGSLLPLAASRVGLSYSQLTERIVDLGVGRVGGALAARARG